MQRMLYYVAAAAAAEINMRKRKQNWSDYFLEVSLALKASYRRRLAGVHAREAQE